MTGGIDPASLVAFTAAGAGPGADGAPGTGSLGARSNRHALKPEIAGVRNWYLLHVSGGPVA
jgi:hypothetical protein